MSPPPDAAESLLQEAHSSKSRTLYKYTAKVFTRRHRLFTLIAALATLSLLGLFLFHSRGRTSFSFLDMDQSQDTVPHDYYSHPYEQGSEVKPDIQPPSQEIDTLDSIHYLRGPPTRKFRDNLRPEYNYLSSWISAGWTNDVITYMNLIYLALITDRIPIMPMFNPSHVQNSSPLTFGDVFDLPRLRKALGKPIIEWKDVKIHHGELDVLGCWNLWESLQYEERKPRGSTIPHQLRLDISYTRAPAWIKMIPHFVHDKHTSFWSLASLSFPETRKANLVPPLASPERNILVPPDEHLLCYDFLYYVAADQAAEFEHDFSPAWRNVGQHMRWTPAIEQLAERAVRRTIGVKDDEQLPPWITVHVRHRDFASWCGDVPVSDCFAKIPVIARRVKEVKDEILERKGIKVDHVIMTSDDDNSTWWDEVAQQGWLRVDYSITQNLYEGWDPVFIDVVIQSNGIGFVGTDKSTVSALARRRVTSWRNGVTRIVRWGKPDSDDH